MSFLRPQNPTRRVEGWPANSAPLIAFGAPPTDVGIVRCSGRGRARGHPNRPQQESRSVSRGERSEDPQTKFGATVLVVGRQRLQV
jgi:hypothetical protein